MVGRSLRADRVAINLNLSQVQIRKFRPTLKDAANFLWRRSRNFRGADLREGLNVPPGERRTLNEHPDLTILFFHSLEK